MFWVWQDLSCWQECFHWRKFLWSLESILSFHSTICFLVPSFQIMFQLFAVSFFAKIKTQPSNLQGEYWIMVISSCPEMFLSDSPRRQKYTFLNQQCKQMVSGPIQSHPSVCDFYTTYTGSHLFSFRQKEETWNRKFIVFCFITGNL